MILNFSCCCALAHLSAKHHFQKTMNFAFEAPIDAKALHPKNIHKTLAMAEINGVCRQLKCVEVSNLPSRKRDLCLTISAPQAKLDIEKKTLDIFGGMFRSR